MGEAPYTLEVTSPGVDRPLTEPRHWRRAIGRLVTVPLTSAAARGTARETDGRAHSPAIEGRVTGADEHGVLIDVDGQSLRFGYEALGPGRIEIEFARLDAIGDSGTQDGADEGGDEEEPDGH